MNRRPRNSTGRRFVKAIAMATVITAIAYAAAAGTARAASDRVSMSYKELHGPEQEVPPRRGEVGRPRQHIRHSGHDLQTEQHPLPTKSRTRPRQGRDRLREAVICRSASVRLREADALRERRLNQPRARPRRLGNALGSGSPAERARCGVSNVDVDEDRCVIGGRLAGVRDAGVDVPVFGRILVRGVSPQAVSLGPSTHDLWCEVLGDEDVVQPVCCRAALERPGPRPAPCLPAPSTEVAHVRRRSGSCAEQ
jgi:hypothetical protein